MQRAIFKNNNTISWFYPDITIQNHDIEMLYPDFIL